MAMLGSTQAKAAKPTEPSWRRNFLPTYTRFVSPLYFSFPGHGKECVAISDSMIPTSEGSISAQVNQRLETVNCVWDASTALCGLLVSHGDQVLNRCIQARGITDFSQPFHVVEIGSGCGLVGVVAGKCLESFAKKLDPRLHVTVIMTDLTDEVKVLEATVQANSTGSCLSNVLAEPLSWGSTDEFDALKQKYSTSGGANFVNLILATDIVYELQHFDDLIATLNNLCPRNSKTMMLMAMERRWADVTGFWWEDCKRAGWKWELVGKEFAGGMWWGEVDKIEFYWMPKGLARITSEMSLPTVDLYGDNDDNVFGATSDVLPGAPSKPALPQAARRSSVDDEVDFGDEVLPEELPPAAPKADKKPLEKVKVVDPDKKALYIEHLAWYTTDQQLLQIAEEALPPSSVSIKDIYFSEYKQNGKSKGIAYMEFATPSAAVTAQQALLSDSDNVLGDLKISVVLCNVVPDKSAIFRVLPSVQMMTIVPGGSGANPMAQGGMGMGQGGMGMPMGNQYGGGMGQGGMGNQMGQGMGMGMNMGGMRPNAMMMNQMGGGGMMGGPPMGMGMGMQQQNMGGPMGMHQMNPMMGGGGPGGMRPMNNNMMYNNQGMGGGPIRNNYNNHNNQRYNQGPYNR
ncbi:hypothetical protein HDU98_006798 [Podochytrium sp. JEL0797]|nr:hypothetical protein HDU98_006798 [Podochytrium sp. JEL0797]